MDKGHFRHLNSQIFNEFNKIHSKKDKLKHLQKWHEYYIRKLPLLNMPLVLIIDESEFYINAFNLVLELENTHDAVPFIIAWPSKYNRSQLKRIFKELLKYEIVKAEDEDKFLSLFLGVFKDKVYWNSTVWGAKAGLFDLISRITGRNVSLSELKRRFDTSRKIHDHDRSRLSKGTMIMDKIFQSIK